MKIAIIGCGYIGISLAHFWSSRGHYITAATRSLKILQDLDGKIQKKVLLDKKDLEQLYSLVEDSEVIVLTAFAQRREDYESDYLEMAEALVQAAIALGEKRRLIFTSNCNVYGDHQGQWVDEDAQLLADSEAALLQIEIEKTLLSLEEFDWRVSILRLADVYGPTEELWKHIGNLQETVLPGSGGNYTNTVHINDVTGSANYVLEHKLTGIYNLVSADHPTQKELADAICEKKGWPKVRWDRNRFLLRNINLRASNHKIKAEGYSFFCEHLDKSAF